MLKKDNVTVRLILALSCLAIILSGCSLLPVEEEPLVPPLIEPAREKINTYEVKLENIAHQVRGFAVFETYDDVYHTFNGPPARLEKIHVKQGDVVKEGDLLITFDIEDYDIRVLRAEIELEKAKNAYLQALQSGNEREMTLRQLELDMANLTFTKTMEELESRTIYAKADGVVTFIERLNPRDVVYDDRVLVIISDMEKIRLYHEVTNPVTIKDVQLGMIADITYKGQTYKATVVQTPNSAPETSDPTLSMRYSRSLYMMLDELPKDLVLRETANMVITLQERENVVAIPPNGLRSYQNRNYVQVLDGTSRREVDVVPGIRSGTRIEIVEGLEAGQHIILQ